MNILRYLTAEALTLNQPLSMAVGHFRAKY